MLRTSAREIDAGPTRGMIDFHGDFDLLAGVHRIDKASVLQIRDHCAYTLLRIVLHMPHIGRDCRRPIAVYHAQQFAPSRFIGGNLRFEIGHILQNIARGVSARRQNVDGRAFA